MRTYTERRLLKENGGGQAEKNAQTFSAGIYSVFCRIYMSRDLAHTSFEHAHLESNWRVFVVMTLTGNLNIMYCLINIFCPGQI